MKHVAIIGAGLSGLTCANRLNSDFTVTVFDKSRGVSGRLSTRYAGDFEFDHGAQYFTARDPKFKQLVLEAISEGHVAPWLTEGPGRAFYQKNGRLEPDTGSDRFVAHPRMNSWAKVWAQELDVKMGLRITSIERSGETWRLSSENGAQFEGFDELVLAIPSPQAIALVPHDFSKMAALRSAKMDACFALMLGFETLADLGWDTLRVENSPIAWLAVNSAKPGRGRAPTLLVHADPQWSNAHADADRDWLMQTLLKETSAITGVKAEKAIHKNLHRWLYASVSASPHLSCLRDMKKQLTLCGDWCLGGRVENAVLSGIAAAEAINDE